MNRPLTIVMYHYVRPLERTRFPEIKGLDVALFSEQLAYLRRFYRIVSAEELLSAVRGPSWDLPRNAALLTFDDGYADHYQYVFPILEEAAIPACFFPPSSVVLERSLLDVNRIHFILASVEKKEALVEDIFELLDRHRADYDLRPNAAYYAELAKASRWDSAEIVFVKRILQRGLPSDLRSRISRELFAKYVSADERAFAEELYLSLDQLRCMTRHGMYVGSHGHAHEWMGQLSPDEQAVDIDRSLELLRSVGTDLSSWIMCYPYGDSNESLRAILREKNCAVGLTTVPDLASGSDDVLLMARLDTNDLPVDGRAPPSSWTKKLGEGRRDG